MASKTPPSETSAQHPTPSAEALGAWLPTQRWFAAKTRRITDLDVEDRVPIGDADLVVVALGLDDGTRHRYAIPLAQSLTPRDALADPSCARALLHLVRERGSTRGRRGTVRGVPTSAQIGRAHV